MVVRETCRALPSHEMKFLSLDLKGVETDGSFEGYASVFHREDLSRDVVMPGAFAHSLRERGTSGIKMLFQHDANQPIGVWSELKEDARGLHAAGRLMPEVAKAREVHALMRAGALAALARLRLGRARSARDRRQRRQPTHSRLLPRGGAGRNPARRGAVVRCLRRRVPGACWDLEHALAHGALVCELG